MGIPALENGLFVNLLIFDYLYIYPGGAAPSAYPPRTLPPELRLCIDHGCRGTMYKGPIFKDAIYRCPYIGTLHIGTLSKGSLCIGTLYIGSLYIGTLHIGTHYMRTLC